MGKPRDNRAKYYDPKGLQLVRLGLNVALIIMFTESAFAQGTGSWRTSGNQILDSSGQVVRIAGVNWYGFETTDQIVHGLWAQDYHTILNQIKSNGYNVIRLPFSNQMVETPSVPSNYSQNNGQPINTDLVGLNSLEVMDKIISAAGAIGLRVILDNHRSEAGNSAEANGLWYTSSYPESAWIKDWKTLVNRYMSFKDAGGNPIVIGVDLRNEPHLEANGSPTGSCWTGDSSTGGCPTSNTAQNWAGAATRAGNAVLSLNPNLLVFVEGIDCYSGDCDWWGGNLKGVASHPIILSASNRLVYSAHDYGPNLFQQSWFNSSTNFSSLSAVWNKFWGYISTNNIGPLWVGEFGTGNNATDLESSTPGSQGQWFESLVNFLENNPNLSWTYWALNGEDSYALLNNQYSGISNSTKQSMLSRIQFPLSRGGGKPNFSVSLNPSSLTVSQGSRVSSTVSVARSGGFTGSVSLTVNGLPSGVSATFNPRSTTSTSTLTLTASTTAFTGKATVTITGTSGSLTHTTTLAITVSKPSSPNFSLSASPSSLSVAPNATGSSIITVARTGGFTGTVSLSARGLPSGITARFNPISVTGTSSKLTLNVSSRARTGTSTITISGTGGNLSHSRAITLLVTSGGAGGVTVTPVVVTTSPYYNEEDVKLTNSAGLTALTVTIVIQRSTGISFSGEYNTVGSRIRESNNSTSSTITYTFTMNPGQTLNPGTYTFAAQTNGTGTTHVTSGDTFSVRYAKGGQSFSQSGRF